MASTSPPLLRRAEHRIIAEALGTMPADWLLDCGCYFGGAPPSS